MNPYFLASIFSSIKSLKRICPKCRKPQIVPSNMKGKPVRCKFCGADIPPEKKAK